jgi:hypothetical protein
MASSMNSAGLTCPGTGAPFFSRQAERTWESLPAPAGEEGQGNRYGRSAQARSVREEESCQGATFANTSLSLYSVGILCHNSYLSLQTLTIAPSRMCVCIGLTSQVATGAASGLRRDARWQDGLKPKEGRRRSCSQDRLCYSFFCFYYLYLAYMFPKFLLATLPFACPPLDLNQLARRPSQSRNYLKRKDCTSTHSVLYMKAQKLVPATRQPVRGLLLSSRWIPALSFLSSTSIFLPSVFAILICSPKLSQTVLS